MSVSYTHLQAEIEKLLGMDSMTFRSCALIMQDQYGLFLQAKKDERIAILGNLLGLGIYGVMELDARKKLADARKELASKKEAVRIKTDFIKAQGNPCLLYTSGSTVSSSCRFKHFMYPFNSPRNSNCASCGSNLNKERTSDSNSEQ